MRRVISSVSWVAFPLVLALFPRVAAAADAPPPSRLAVAAVYSDVAKEYRRTKLPDGSFAPEYYVLSFGGQVERTESDETIDRVQSRELVELLRTHLATQNYLLAADPADAGLLLRVNWGRTVPFTGDINHAVATTEVAQALTAMGTFSGIGDDGYVSREESAAADAAASDLESAMLMIAIENRRREQASRFNAGLLGYRAEMNKWQDSPARFSAGSDRLYELRDDVEAARYYLLIFAYDRRSVIEEHKPRLLWATRISIRAQGNRFDENLAAMIARASRYFGRDSGGLVRRYEGTVEFGEAKVIGVVEDEVDAAPEVNRAPEKSAVEEKP